MSRRSKTVEWKLEEHHGKQFPFRVHCDLVHPSLLTNDRNHALRIVELRNKKGASPYATR